MKKIVFTFGAIAGAIVAAMMAIMMPLLLRGVIDFDKSEIVGYTSMILAFLLVFFGIRSYRDNIGGGTVTFGRAFKVGILITLVACAVYVISWEIVYFNFIPDFLDRYTTLLIDKMRESGASAAAIEAKSREMAEFKRLYANPLFNVAITFMEVFPVGLIVTLVSAAILRRKPAPGAPAPATALA
jgi:hypothetical protein